MVLPRVLAALLVLGSFRHVMFTCRQLNRHDASYQPFETWPPPQTHGTRRRQIVFNPEVVDDPMHGLDALQSDLVQWEPLLLNNVHDSDARATLEGKVTQHLQFLQSMKAQLPLDDGTNMSHYLTFELVEALRAAWLLRSSEQLALMSHQLVLPALAAIDIAQTC